MLAGDISFADEDEGEPFDFDDIPEAACPPPALPVSRDQNKDSTVNSQRSDLFPTADPPVPSSAAPSSADGTVATAGGAASEAEGTSAAEGTDDRENDLPPPPLPPLDDDTETRPAATGMQSRSAGLSLGQRVLPTKVVFGNQLSANNASSVCFVFLAVTKVLCIALSCCAYPIWLCSRPFSSSASEIVKWGSLSLW